MFSSRGECTRVVAPEGETQAIDTNWPLIDITAGDVDGDALLLAYKGQSWGSNDQEYHPDLEDYDHGKREGVGVLLVRG